MAVKQTYIDTSLILAILLETEKSNLAQQVLETYGKYEFVISGIAVNETLYVATHEYYRQKGMIKGRHSLRKLIAKQGYPKEVIDTLDSLLKDLNVEIINDYFEYAEYLKILQEYKLLPNDAQIVLTCRHRGIKTILTFDDDFKRVPWLNPVP
ncbi:MAG: PIN domain-containing protein [Desulfurococcales archaeon]|nr:PIN domain-containing protein [Desulfurococcales archaeon]